MPGQDYAIHFHAGAHRTGSSSFQVFLGLNRAAIAQAGYDLAYPARDGARGGRLRAKLPEPRHAPAQAEKRVADLAANLASLRMQGQRGMIVSEENLPGRMLSFFKGRFYPQARERAGAMRAALGTPVARLTVVVRPYDALFASAWRDFAERRAMKPFDYFRPAMAAFLGGWPDLVADLAAGLEAREVVVVPYASRGDDAALLGHVVPGLRLDAPVAAPRTNTSPGDSALAMLQRLYHQGVDLDPGKRARIVARHAGTPQGDPVAAFRPDEAEVLRARYEEDLGRLARSPGVTLVAAGAAGSAAA